MKKLLLLGAMLLGLGGATYAETFNKVTGFGDAITSLDYIINGGKFVISDGTKVMYFASNQDSKNDALEKVPVDSYYYMTLEKVDDSDATGDNIYRIRIQNGDGTNYPKGINGGSYVNITSWGSLFSGTSAKDKDKVYGTDNKNWAIWYVSYDAEKGFSFQNVGREKWLKADGTADGQQYLKLYKSLVVEEVINPIEPGTYDATDAKTDCFAGFKTLVDGATYDADAKVFTKTCGWQWDGEGLDLSAYRYIVITAGSSREEAGAGYMSIKDKNGVVVGGDDYGEGYQNMWFSLWNHLFCCKIDLEKLRSEKMFDIRHITELTIDGGDYFMLGTAYATNKEPQVRNRWGQNEEGSVRIMGLTADKFGTICLPYQAAVACAKIYEIAGKGENSISLVEHDGLLEAGKAYFYCTTKNTAEAATENKVFFYQATAATVASPVENNGLIGTFSDIDPLTGYTGKNFYVLSNNDLYRVDSDVKVGANKAYIDKDKIVNKGASAKLIISFNDLEEDATGITETDAVETLDGKFYDLSGREVANPTPGIYIVNGKKVVIK